MKIIIRAKYLERIIELNGTPDIRLSPVFAVPVNPS